MFYYIIDIDRLQTTNVRIASATDLLLQITAKKYKNFCNLEMYSANYVLFVLRFAVAQGINKAESQNHLSRGNQLLNAGQLADALTHYHAAIGRLKSSN